MTKRSRDKGKRGEREAAKALEKYTGIPARRRQQFSGTEGADDVAWIDDVHVEVKRCEKLNLYEAMKQAEEDAGENVPIVLHRRNGKPWLIALKLEDLERFICKFDYAANFDVADATALTEQGA